MDTTSTASTDTTREISTHYNKSIVVVKLYASEINVNGMLKWLHRGHAGLKC
jgi:hypothetical protein